MAINDNQAPEDVEALCSRAQMDTAHYKVFQRPRRPMRNAPVAERPPEQRFGGSVQAGAEEAAAQSYASTPMSAAAAASAPMFVAPPFSPVITPQAQFPVYVPPSPQAAPQTFGNPAAQVLSNPETAFTPSPATAQPMPNPAPRYEPAATMSAGPAFGVGVATRYSPEANLAGEDEAAPATAFSGGFAAAVAAAQSGAQFGYPAAGAGANFANHAAAPNGAPVAMPQPHAMPSSLTGEPNFSEMRSPAGITIPMETPGQAAEAVRRRWAMLRGLSTDDAMDLQTGDGGRVRVPIFSIVGLSGGSGRTTAAATLTAALSRMGERVLLVHGLADDMTPCHFGITTTRPGWARAVAPRYQGAGAIYLLAYEEAVEDSPRQASDWLGAQLSGLQGQLDRIIVQTRWREAKNATFVALANACIALLTPDVKCLYRLSGFRRWLAAQQQLLGHPLPVGYLLNKFDPAVTFHADMQQWLRCELGNRLLSFTIRRTDAITEALGTGTTLIEYAPDSPAVNDFLRLAAWTRDVGIRQLAAKA
jgi:cellulose synthase operon protein YhjQ